MKAVLMNYRVTPQMQPYTYIRKARKEHHCCGGHNGEKPTPCNRPIAKNAVYVEYVGEAVPFQCGKRYHPECAEQQGIVVSSQPPLKSEHQQRSRRAP